MKKIILLMMLSSTAISMSVSANAVSALESQCVPIDSNVEINRVFKKNVRIKSYSISTVLGSSSSVNKEKYGFVVAVKEGDNNTNSNHYHVVLKAGDQSEYRDQLSSTARMAKVLNLPVNICVDKDSGNGFLLGIEFF